MDPTKVLRGRVSLVGAGPGDPDLLTVKAVRALAECDLVLYDALVPSAVVSLARAMAIPVGKRAGKRSTPQDVINRLMIRAAKRGRHVVRLKCGDPFVFGRGGEEMLALRDAGIPVEVIPGLSSAIAAPASAGVPVTHRGLASGFVVLTGHPEDTWRGVVARIAPRSLTLVLMMSLAARGAIAGELTANAWPASTPVLVVLGATHPGSWSWRGTLGELSSMEIPEAARHLAGTIVVGDVAALAQVSANGKEPITLAGGAA